MLPIHFYYDWKFWSFAVALLALILSQLPPLHLLFKKAKLEVEIFSALVITHHIGNPNAVLHLILSNTGGRELKIKSVDMIANPGSKAELTLPGKNYFQNPGDKTTVLLTRIKLKPQEEWAHIVTFFPQFSRQEERIVKEMKLNLKDEIGRKLAEAGANVPKDGVIADNEYVKPIMDFFEKKFYWQPGEYVMRLKIEAEPQSASFSKDFKFTVFESDSKELYDASDRYKKGFAVYIDDPNFPLIRATVSEA